MKVLYFCSGRYLDSPIGVHFFKRSCMTLTCALSFAEQKESAAEPVPKVKSKKRRKWCTCAISLFFSSLLFVRRTVSYVLNICTYVNNELWCVCTRLCVCMFVLLWAQDDHLDFHTAPELWALHLMFLQPYVSSPQCSCSLMFPHFSVPAVLYFHTSVFLQPYISTPQCSCSLMFPHLSVPAALCFLTSVFLQPYVSTPQCSRSLMFPHLNVPVALCSLSPMFSELRCSLQWIHMDLTLTAGQTLSDLAQPQTHRGTQAQTPTTLH